MITGATNIQRYVMMLNSRMNWFLLGLFNDAISSAWIMAH